MKKLCRDKILWPHGVVADRLSDFLESKVILVDRHRIKSWVKKRLTPSSQANHRCNEDVVKVTIDLDGADSNDKKIGHVNTEKGVRVRGHVRSNFALL